MPICTCIRTSKGYTLRHISHNMFQVTKCNGIDVSYNDRLYIQRNKWTNELTDAGTLEPCYWLGNVVEAF